MTDDQRKAVEDLKAKARKYEDRMRELQIEKDEVRKHLKAALAEIDRIAKFPDQQMLPYSIVGNDRRANGGVKHQDER